MKKYIVIALLMVLGTAYPAYARWAVGAAGGGAAAGPEVTEDCSSVTNFTNIAHTLSSVSGVCAGTNWETTTAYHNTELSSIQHYAKGDLSYNTTLNDSGGLIVRSNGTTYYYCRIETTNIACHDNSNNHSWTYAHGLTTENAWYTLTVKVAASGAAGENVTLTLYVTDMDTPVSWTAGSADSSADRLDDAADNHCGIYIDENGSATNNGVDNFECDAL